MGDLVIACLLGLAGGGFGAAIGGNMAFGVVAIVAPVCWLVSARTGSTFAIDWVAFGPFLGPHVAFSGGAAATIYAARRGLLESGRLVNLPLAPLRDWRVFGVAAAFGGLGVVVKSLVAATPWLGAHTDPVAMTVLISGLIARFLFGDRTLLHRRRLNEADTWSGRIAPTAEHCWLPNQQQPRHYLLLGAAIGGISGGACLVLGHLAPAAATTSNTVMFGVAGWAVIAVTLERRAWITHHIANVGGLAAILIVPRMAAPGTEPWSALTQADALAGATLALTAAVVAGVAAAAAAELGARLFLNRSDSYLDPPAMSIWVCTTLMLGVLGGG